MASSSMRMLLAPVLSAWLPCPDLSRQASWLMVSKLSGSYNATRPSVIGILREGSAHGRQGNKA